MLHLALMVPLLTAPPTLAERLRLGAVPELTTSMSADPAGPRGLEVAAGAAGMALGQVAPFVVATLANSVFRSCNSDVCGVSPFFFPLLIGVELLAPAASAALAWAVAPASSSGSFLRAWGMATLGHLGAAALAVPLTLLAIAVNAGPVTATVVAAIALSDLTTPAVFASWGLHPGRETSVPVLQPEAPPPVELLPPPQGARPVLMLPLAFRF